MIVKGLLRICKGIFSSNQLTFEDAEVTPPVTLKRLTEDHHNGFTLVQDTEVFTVRENKQSLTIGDLVIDGEIIVDGELLAGEYA